MFSIANMPPQLLDPGAQLTVTAIETGPDLSSVFIYVATSVIGMDGDPIALEGVLCCNSLTLQNMADRDRVQEYWAARPPHVMDVGIRLDDDEELEEHSDEADERVNTDDVDMEEEESSVDWDEVDKADGPHDFWRRWSGRDQRRRPHQQSADQSLLPAHCLWRLPNHQLGGRYAHHSLRARRAWRQRHRPSAPFAGLADIRM